MTLSQIRYFEAVCENASISKAADQLYVSRSALSRIIRDLEKEFGVELFVRSKHGVELTESGKMLRKFFREFSGTYSAISERLRKIEQYRVLRHLKVAITPTCGKKFYPGFYKSFRAAYPDIRFSIIELPSGECTESLVMGKLDFAISPGRNEYPTVLDQIPLYSHQMVLCVAKDDPLSHNEYVSLSDFNDRNIATLSAPVPYNLENNLVFQTSQQELLRRVVAGGDAVSILPYDMVENWQGISYIPFMPPRPYTVQLCWNKTVPHNTAFYEVLEYVKKYDFKNM